MTPLSEPVHTGGSSPAVVIQPREGAQRVSSRIESSEQYREWFGNVACFFIGGGRFFDNTPLLKGVIILRRVELRQL